MNKWLTAIALFMTFSTSAAVCEKIKHKEGEIVHVNSAIRLGGRIQLPGNLQIEPIVSNPHLWDVEGTVGTNQIVLKPNSQLDQGKRTMIYAFTEDGKAFDIVANRVKEDKNQPCIWIQTSDAYFNEAQKRGLRQLAEKTRYQAQVPMQVDTTRISQLEKQLAELKKSNDLEKKTAVIDALRKYRYRIYTRYQWDEGKAFVGANTVADVWDDGQFTFIRLANPNRGLLSVETLIGGKVAIAPTKYDDAYGIYRVTGIYPKFTMRIDDVKLEVTRSDNATKGNI